MESLIVYKQILQIVYSRIYISHNRDFSKTGTEKRELEQNNGENKILVTFLQSFATIILETEKRPKETLDKNKTKMSKEIVMKKVLKTAALLVVACTVFSGQIWAQPPWAVEGNGEGMHSNCHKGGGGRRIFRGLDLTKEQKERIAEIMKSNREELKHAAEPLKEARKKLMGITHLDAFDEQAIRKACKTLAIYTEEMAVIRARAMAKAKTVLTPEQKEKLTQKRERFRKQKMRKHQKRRDNIDEWIDNSTEN